MILRPLAMVASVSNDNRASTSVETYPGTIFVISAPKFTATLSYVMVCNAKRHVWERQGLVKNSTGLSRDVKKSSSFECILPWREPDLPWSTWQRLPKDACTAPYQQPKHNIQSCFGKRRDLVRTSPKLLARPTTQDSRTNLEDQRGIRRGILRFQAFDRVDISRVGDDNGILFELVELRRHDGWCGVSVQWKE